MKPILTIERNGDFKVEHADRLNYLYFPLTNFKSLKSSITPKMGGDAKIDQNTFLLAPTTNEDYHNSMMNRNMYFRVDDTYTWSITGNTPYQLLHKDDVTVEGTFLAHTLTRKHLDFQCIIESFVPIADTYQELHRITFRNTSKSPLKLKPVISFPLYSRSADNIRDHRHVTSLLNQATILRNGIINKPTFSFDERGHVLNKMNYGVFVKSRELYEIKNYWPVMEEFIGEGGTLLDPFVVSENRSNSYKVHDVVSGYEITGAFEYGQIVLNPSEEIQFIISLMVSESKKEIINNAEDLSTNMFTDLWNYSKTAWNKELSNLQFKFQDDRFNGWLKWATLQPILRRIYGCSFMPHHDYGRGGRGWRDLWQDSLALILMNPIDVRTLLLNNFIGVRIDGSNATIIGDKPGEFLADRNHIARVWMDHGSWPFITTMLYVNKSGDYMFLLEQQKYFQDQFTHYTKKVNTDLKTKDNILHSKDGTEYRGTVLEHLILQNLVPFYNVGDHNNIRIEGADWNDALDMASKKGESVAFTALYAKNLVDLAATIHKLEQRGIASIEMFEEISLLLESVHYQDIQQKRDVLGRYFNIVEHGISGKKKQFELTTLADLLMKKGFDMIMHIRFNEWMEQDNFGWFNGYYDGDGQPLEDIELKHMTLTGQVFAIYSGTATREQIRKIVQSADDLLFDEVVGGYKLNTDFKELRQNMGRLFGFAYGHKENGAMFSHMAMMYANALYKQGYAKEGNKVLETIYNHCIDISKSKIYPGIPEYIDPKGRGMYHYLTGSASWLILTEVTEVFGIKADMGTLILEPKLLKKQFDHNHQASIITLVDNRPT